MNAKPDERAPGGYGLAARMRAGVTDAVRDSVRVRALGPAALVSFLTAAAFTPLLVPLVGAAGGGEVGAVLGQVGGIGGGYLAGFLTSFTERTRRSAQGTAEPASGESIRAELALEIEHALKGEAGKELRAEVAAVLRGIDAVGAALAADRDNVLAPGLAAVGEQLADFRWVLGDLATRLTEVQRTLLVQGVSQRSHLLAARGELDTITRLLQRVLAAQEAQVPAQAAAGTPGAGRKVCPYPGLRPFESRDARWFFGRQELTAHLIVRLAGQLGTGSPLFLIGPSGAGKSSLLRAGLIPGLRAGLLPAPGSRRWPRVLLGRPGAQPMAALEKALAGRGSADRMTLVVDQLEDIFTQCHDPAERLRFAREVLELCARGALVVIGLRADFYADCAEVAELGRLLPDSQLMVGPMSEDELRLAITRPAAAAGCAVEPGLTELLLSDLRSAAGGHEPGALPLLAYALQATWYRRSGRTLTVAGYREAGGIHGAIAGEADRIYADFPPATQQVVRRIMLRMVSVGASAVTRRQVPRADLVAGLDGADKVLAGFTQARLVSADAGGVEITHDAFLEAWPRLRDWIAEDLAGLRLRRQVAEDARSWADEGRDPGGLYRGIRLGNARNWRATGDNESDLAAPEREFLDASSAAEEAERAETERRRQAERRQNRRLRLLTAGLAVVLAAALVATGLALYNGQNANMRGAQAQADSFALQSDEELSVNVARADLLALAGWQESHTETALSSLLSREADPYLGSFPLPSDYQVTSLAISPDGKLLAVGGFAAPGGQISAAGARRSSVQLWSMLTRGRLAIFPDLGGLAESASFSPDGTTLAVAVLGRSLRFWNVATRKAVPNPTGDMGRVSALAYRPDQRILAVAQGPTHVIDLWNLITHRLSGRLSGDTNTVWSLAFSPDGRTLASGSADGTARLWNVAAGTERSVLHAGPGSVDQVEFSPDGGLVALSTTNGSVWYWNMAKPSLVVPNALYFGTSDTPSIAFSREGQYLYALDPGRGRVTVYDLVNNTDNLVTLGPHAGPLFLASSRAGTTLVLGGSAGSLLAYDEGHRTFYEPNNSSVLSVELSRDGRVAATAAGDGTVQFWNPGDPVAPARILATGLPNPDTMSLSLSPDGQLVAASGPGNSVVLWRVASGTRVATLRPSSVPGAVVALAEGLAFSPDGKTLAGYSNNGTAVVWDVATGRQIASFRARIPRGGDIAGLAFSPDGRTLAIDGYVGEVLLWDFRSNAVTGRLATGQTGPDAVAFSPDGRVLAAAGANSTVRLWTVGTRNVGLITLPTAVRSLAFSPDGSMLVTVGEDTSVRLWNVASRQPIAVLSGHTDQVNEAVFGPDGRTLITASADNTARVWDVDPADEVRALCAALKGPGFDAEWHALSPSPPNPCTNP